LGQRRLYAEHFSAWVDGANEISRFLTCWYCELVVRHCCHAMYDS
jgi:hypothetical protein